MIEPLVETSRDILSFSAITPTYLKSGAITSRCSGDYNLTFKRRYPLDVRLTIGLYYTHIYLSADTMFPNLQTNLDIL